MTPCFQRLCKLATYLKFICTLLLKGSFYCTPAFQESLIGFTAVVVWKVFAYAVQKYFPIKYGILLSRARKGQFKCFCVSCSMKCGHERKYSWLISSGMWLPIMTRGGDFYNFSVGVMFILGKNSLHFDGHLNSFRPFGQFSSHIEFLFLLVVTFNLSRLQNVTQKIENSSNFR